MLGLDAPSPDPAIGAAADLFAPLIGNWRILSIRMPLGEPRAEYEGFWSFRWGLGGRAVYDVIGYRLLDAPSEEPYRTGITVRFYDLDLQTWRQVWVGAYTGTVIEFAVRAEGRRIVIDGQHSATTRYRWTFEEITATHLWWEGRTSNDGGATWHLGQTIEGWRTDGNGINS
jgi:hypothetical protein